MVKLDIVVDEPSIDLSSCHNSRSSTVPLSGKVVLTVEKPVQIKAISLKYECINSHGEVYVYYNLHRSTKVIPPGFATVPVGVHEYPFVFQVPRHLPPSIRATLGAVNHRLRASIKRPGNVTALLHKMAGLSGSTKIALTVHNSNHTHTPVTHDSPYSPSPDDPPAYSSNRRQWHGKRRNGQIDWCIQGPASVHISHRIDVLAKLTIAKGYGTVKSATVDLYQVEKYQASPDPNIWTFPVEIVNDEEDIPSGSDDGFPETRTMGVSLKQAVALTPFGGSINTHCREKRSQPVKSVTKMFPPPPDPCKNTTGYTFHLAVSLPLPEGGALMPAHTSPLINISHRLRIRFAFSPAGTKELGMILPITILPAPTPNSLHAPAVAELNCLESAETAENFWMVLVEEEGEYGPTERSRMDSGGVSGHFPGLPPQYDDPNWPLCRQERRGSIQIDMQA